MPAARRREAAQLLARAFRDNPLNRAVVGPRPERRLRCNEIGMRTHLEPAGRAGQVLAAEGPAGRLTGVLIGVPPGGWPLPLPAFGARLWLLWRQGSGVAGRWAEVARRLEEDREIGPHAYLATLGVDPEQAGQGVGSSLVRAWLGTVDAARAATYLETDDPRNIPFYRRVGFEVIREIRILGVPVSVMRRSAAVGGH